MKLVLLLLPFLFISCNTSEQEETLITNQDQKDSLRVSKKDIEAIKYTDYGLSSASRKAVESWENYSQLEDVVSTIKNGDLSYFESDKEILKSFIIDIQTNLPTKITSQSIEARLRSLETKLFKLRSAVSLSTTKKEELITDIKEFLISVSNLNLQINKKLEKESQDVGKPIS